MRLINVRTYSLEEFHDNAIPPYAILSHTWGDQEVSIHDMTNGTQAKRKKGFKKIQYACEQAHADYLGYVWVDTCCIDKSSSAELQEAINSMYRWYSLAQICYAYLEDMLSSCIQLTSSFSIRAGPGKVIRGHIGFALYEVEELEFWLKALVDSRWFTRGWTLQELIAPPKLAFFGCDWNFIGSRDDSRILEAISKATSIDKLVLSHSKSVMSVSVANKMGWAAGRKTSRIEDHAYSLLGLFGVNMPMLYGEGDRAFKRLQEEIIKTINDHTILAWNSGNTRHGTLLAEEPSDFINSKSLVSWGLPAPLEITNRGLRAALPILNRDDTDALALRVRPYHNLNAYHVWEGDWDEENFSRLTLVDHKRIAEASIAFVEITHGSQTESDAVKELKLCICLARESDSADIVEADTSQGKQIARNVQSVVMAPDYIKDGRFGALIRFESGEELVVVLLFNFEAVFSYGVYAWFVNWGGETVTLPKFMSLWERPKGRYYPKMTSLQAVSGRHVTANIGDRVILGERVILATVHMNDKILRDEAREPDQKRGWLDKIEALRNRPTSP